MTQEQISDFCERLLRLTERGLIENVSVKVSDVHGERIPREGYAGFARSVSRYMESRKGIQYEVLFAPHAKKYVATRIS